MVTKNLGRWICEFAPKIAQKQSPTPRTKDNGGHSHMSSPLLKNIEAIRTKKNPPADHPKITQIMFFPSTSIDHFHGISMACPYFKLTSDLHGMRRAERSWHFAAERGRASRHLWRKKNKVTTTSWSMCPKLFGYQCSSNLLIYWYIWMVIKMLWSQY